METLSLHITLQPRQPWSEILIAQLAEMGFDAFEETATGLTAYGPAPQITLQEVYGNTLLSTKNQEEHAGAYTISVKEERIPFQNWNAAWEADFQPVFVEDKLSILAPFHDKSQAKGMVVEIQPQMSFGTGHHQTTWLMAKAMLDHSMLPQRVLDMGTGTGVLAILAEKLGVGTILAIDIEDWSVENTKENAQRNGCKNIEALCGDVDLLAGKKFDLILANINKNVLKVQIPEYAKTTPTGGELYLSGFFESDVPEMITFTEPFGYRHQKTLTKETWAMVQFTKK